MMEFEMVDKGMLFFAFLLGMILSGIYFGLLWLTVRQLVHRTRPEIVLLLSLLLRLFLLLSCFYLILHYGSWTQLLAALAGFITLRILLLRKFKPASMSQSIATDTEAS
jgi:F1F0 ATPase subunit 2